MLVTASGREFEVEFAAPVSITENIMFYAEIIGSDMETVHNTFKNPEETEHLSIKIEGEIAKTYDGYTRYCGFDIRNNGNIRVTLKKQPGATIE